MEKRENMIVIAHRGYYEKSPYLENTIEGLLYALKQKEVGGVELDVRMTKDHVFVIHHDLMIDKTSDGVGIISHMSLPDLYQYQFGTKEYPSKIATLKNFLDVVDTKKEILLEIKNSIEKDFVLVKQLLSLLKKYSHLSLKICTFSESILKELKKQNCPFPIGKISFLKEKRLLGSFQSIYYKNQLDLSFPYYIWTIKTKEEFLKIKKELGKTCLGVITDIPKTIYDAL